MNRIDYGMEDYQVNVLRTANQRLSWNETVENCLLGLIGELGEVIYSLNPTNNVLFEQFIAFGKIAELIKKHKYHGKLINEKDFPPEVYEGAMMVVNEDNTFMPDVSWELTKELGDTLYYLTWLIDTCGLELSDVAQLNVEKLRKRYGDSFSVEKSLNRND